MTTLPTRLRELADARFKRGEIGGGQALRLAADYIEALEAAEERQVAKCYRCDEFDEHEECICFDNMDLLDKARADLQAVRERIGGA